MEVNKKPLKRINSQKENIIKGLNPPENILGNEEELLLKIKLLLLSVIFDEDTPSVWFILCDDSLFINCNLFLKWINDIFLSKLFFVITKKGNFKLEN